MLYSAPNLLTRCKRSKAILLATLMAVVLVPEDALARAGSGQSYHSSSSPSRSSSSTSSSSSASRSSSSSSTWSGSSWSAGRSAPSTTYIPIPVPIHSHDYSQQQTDDVTSATADSSALTNADQNPQASIATPVQAATGIAAAMNSLAGTAPDLTYPFNFQSSAFMKWLVPAIGFGAVIILTLKFMSGAFADGFASSAPQLRSRPVEVQKQSLSRMEVALASLRARDPAFTADIFTERVAAAFKQIQAAWSAQDMRPARSFISDGVMERFGLQILWMKDDGIRNLVQDVGVSSAQIIEIESDSQFDTIHVRIDAEAEDSDVRIADGAVVRPSEGRSSFVEVWSFLRKPGAKTLTHPGAMEGCCPSCGAAMLVLDTGTCGACQAVVNSGQYDWVLSEITQTSEWSVREPAVSIPGFKDVAAADPSFNVQYLEDRVSVAFWRWMRALYLGNTDSLAPMATEALLQNPQGPARGPAYRDVAVGSVEVTGISQKDNLDRAEVLVKWSGRKSGDSEATQFFQSDTVFTLVRKSGLTTNAGASMVSSRCPSCGAAINEHTMAQCEFCGTHLNDPARHWVVSDIKTPSTSPIYGG